MKTKYIALIAGAAIACFLTGCASQPVTVQPVGPDPAYHTASPPHGYLRVYSDTETHEIGDNTFYYPHTSYSVYDLSGRRVKWVANHIGDMDESPTLVKLPVGHYNVVAESASYGRVTVPVIIEEAKRTTLHLDRGWRAAAGISSNAMVHLPDGEPVGWRVASTR
jgi:hypothetical protein